MTQKKTTKRKVTRRKKRRIRKPILIVGIALIVAIVALFKLPTYLTDRKLEKLGYNKTEIANMKEMELEDFIITNEYYSPLLAKQFLNKSFDMNYLPLYLVLDEDTELEEEDLLLYNRLEDLGYESDQLQNLFTNLEFWEMTPLLIFDYQYNEQPYIDDCIANRDHNSQSSFSLTNSYITYYSKTANVQDFNSVDVLVNKKIVLTAENVPSDLTAIDTTYATDNIYLRQEATDAFLQFAMAGSSNGARIYAVLGYRSYEDQESAYNLYAYYNGESAALAYAAKAGSSEHQTGLAVNVSVVGESAENFSATNAYQWCKENSAEYGFIERYPSGKEYITGYTAESDHFRYVGKDIAEKVIASQLTYDEYYALYLASWHDESYKPAFLSN